MYCEVRFSSRTRTAHVVTLFFFDDTATTGIFTLSPPRAPPIFRVWVFAPLPPPLSPLSPPPPPPDFDGPDAAGVWQVPRPVPSGAHLLHHWPDPAVRKRPEGPDQGPGQGLRRHLLRAAEQRRIPHVRTEKAWLGRHRQALVLRERGAQLNCTQKEL